MPRGGQLFPSAASPHPPRIQLSARVGSAVLHNVHAVSPKEVVVVQHAQHGVLAALVGMEMEMTGSSGWFSAGGRGTGHSVSLGFQSHLASKILRTTKDHPQRLQTNMKTAET